MEVINTGRRRVVVVEGRGRRRKQFANPNLLKHRLFKTVVHTVTENEKGKDNGYKLSGYRSSTGTDKRLQ